MTCMFCGAHMNLTQHYTSSNKYICPECATEYRHEWTLPIFAPGTDILTTYGEYLITITSENYNKPKEKVYKELLSKRRSPSIA